MGGGGREDGDTCGKQLLLFVYMGSQFSRNWWLIKDTWHAEGISLFKDDLRWALETFGFVDPDIAITVVPVDPMSSPYSEGSSEVRDDA